MPSVATGAMLANKTMTAIGVSGDGDTGAIGIGQFMHLMRRNLPLVYIIENNGCYGLTKGQFSPTADIGSTLKNGVVNDLQPIDTCPMAIELGASFVGRSFSGDKKQLLTLLKAALAHRGTCCSTSLAVRHLQRPRGVDEELHLREGSRGAGHRARTTCRPSRTSQLSTSRARRGKCSCTTARASTSRSSTRTTTPRTRHRPSRCCTRPPRAGVRDRPPVRRAAEARLLFAAQHGGRAARAAAARAHAPVARRARGHHGSSEINRRREVVRETDGTTVRRGPSHGPARDRAPPACSVRRTRVPVRKRFVPFGRGAPGPCGGPEGLPVSPLAARGGGLTETYCRF